MTNKLLFIGAEPGYPRRQDVVLQTHLVRPGMVITESLEELARRVKTSMRNRGWM